MSAVLWFLIGAVFIGLPLGWVVGHPLGWWFSFRKDGAPFSWRVWLGPDRYYDWWRS